MEATGHLITSHLQIPADAVAHGDIQAAAEIPFSMLEELAEGVVPENGLGRGPEGTLTTLTEPTLNSSTPPSPAMEKPLTPSPSGKGTTPLHAQLGISKAEAQYLMDLAVAFYNTGLDIDSEDCRELEDSFEALTGFYIGDDVANKGRAESLAREIDRESKGPRYAASAWLGSLGKEMAKRERDRAA